VCRGAVDIPLPGKTFDLLEALVLAAPDPLSTDQLMDQVWRGVIVSPTTIAKRVELLRQALGDDSNEPRYVALVRGHGYRLIPEVSPVGRQQTRYRRVRFVAVVLGITIVLAAIAWITPRPAQLPLEKSIAVLPFIALSEDPKDQVFADGLTEELGHILASGGELKVAGRNSSFYFMHQQQDVQAIGERLGVAQLLRGTVRRAGEKIRVTAQLVSTNTGFDLWSASYDRQMTDLIEIQKDIARNVAARLSAAIGTDVAGSIAVYESISAEAYALYLRAVSLSPYGKFQGLAEAQQLSEQVTSLAPEFAPGWNRLAAIHGRRLFAKDPEYAYTPEEAMPIMYHAVARALSIDPNSAEAYANLGGAAWVFEGDARKAAPLIERAVYLAPWDLDIISFAAEFAKYIGRLDEALELEELRVARDPLCEQCRLRLADSYLFAHRLADAEHQLSTLSSMTGNYKWRHGMVLLLMQRPQLALQLFNQVDNADQMRLGRMLVLCDSGQAAEYQTSLSELERVWGDEHPQWVAKAFAYCGFNDKAFYWLDRFLPEGTLTLQIEFPHPLYDRLREDPRWTEIMRRIERLPEQTQTIPFSLDTARARLTH
jgi:TolB-like protein